MLQPIMASKIGAVLARKIGGQVLGDFNEHFKTEVCTTRLTFANGVPNEFTGSFLLL